MKNAVDGMAKLVNCSSGKPNVACPSFRGVMTWSINWDKHDGYNFSVPIGSCLRTLP